MATREQVEKSQIAMIERVIEKSRPKIQRLNPEELIVTDNQQQVRIRLNSFSVSSQVNNY